MKIITEEMKYRKRMCDYAIKHGVSKAARRYHTNRKFVYRQLEKYDGTVKSLILKSRRPYHHPNQHTKSELEILNQMRIRYGHEGYAEIYVQAMKRGYKRSYGSMSKQIRKLGIVEFKRKLKTSYVKYVSEDGKYPGDKVQIDIKYVPMECLLFPHYEKRYYQITAIDEYSRKRILEIVDDKSTYSTSKFVKKLEKRFGFKLNIIQTDNGPEFVNIAENGIKTTLFEDTLKQMDLKHKRTRPYSPWQNGKVERSHKLDNERFYNRQEFKSLEEMKKKLARYNTRYNNISRKVLNFKTPNQMVLEYAN
ncbi:MAG: DDE-type integrase/transposase/recombinase [Bacilli bacterium]|nr:DDE-type integrase/transposase/recombinase [Bacilli bacterium]